MQSFIGLTVTLPLANTPYRLWDLIQAVLGSASQANSLLPDSSCSELSLQANAGNSGNVFIGSQPSTLSATNCGIALVATAAYRIGPYNFSAIPLASIFVEGTDVNQQINVLGVSV